MEDPKAVQIIAMFAEGKNAAEVAKALGYSDHQSVNQYMRRRGYRWDPRLRNYVPKADGTGDEKMAGPAPLELVGGARAGGAARSDRNGEKPAPARVEAADPGGDAKDPVAGTLPVLEDVEDQEAVRELLRRAPELLRLLRSVETPESRLGLRPRERSRPEVTKGFRIAVELDRRLEQFCAEHGVMQKDVIETALWEFLESRAGA